MTTSVADKTPISAKDWRRHTDSPSLWIVVTISSVSLHILAFWLMRSSNAFRPWFPQQSQAAVPIEFVEISPQAKPKSTVKKVTPKPLVSSQQSVPSRLPQKAPNTPKNQNSDAISSENTIIDSSKTEVSQANIPPRGRRQEAGDRSSKTEVSQANTPLFPQKIVSTPKPTPTNKPKPTPTPIPTIPVGDLPWNRRQQIELGKGKPLPTSIPSIPLEQPRVSETEQEQTPRIPGEETTSTPTGETPRIPGEEMASTPTGETPRIPKQGGSIAIAAPLSRNEALQLIQEGRLWRNDLPDVLAKYQGSNTKTLDSSFLPGDSELQSAQLLTSLTIDENGKFQQAVVVEIEPAKLQSEKILYEKIINELFSNENFLPGHNQNGTKPELSYLYVKITVKPINSN